MALGKGQDMASFPHVPADRLARLFETARGHAYIWAEAADAIANRILANQEVTSVATGDAALLIIAVRNVLRAAELAQKVSTGAEEARIAAAIAKFRQELPDAEDMRDILDHFDRYEIGQGYLQRDARKSGGSTEFYRVSLDRDTFTVKVGSLSLDVQKVKEAAIELATTILIDP
jgi:hypothetical protein